MSYNIDTVDYIGEGRLTIDSKIGLAFAKKHQDRLPESHLFEDLEDDEGTVVIENPRWCSEGSGYRFDLFKAALALTKGEADLVLVWEGGDSTTGLRVVNGEVTEKKVKHVLVD